MVPVALLLNVLPLGAWLVPRPVVQVCVDAAEVPALASLGASVRLATVVAGCGGGGLHARFEGAGGRVELTLEAASGETLSRVVPWLTGSADPIARTALADRMGALGVLLDGLLLEHQLATPEPPEAAGAPPGAEALPAPAQPLAPPVAPPPSRRVAPRPRPRPAPEAAVVAAPTPAPVAAPGTEAPFDPGPAPPPEPAPILTLAPQPPTPRVRVIPLPAPPPTPWWGGVHLASRWRAPGVVTPQAELVGGYRWARLGLGWQPGLQWAWDGRTFASDTFDLSLAGLVPLRSGDGWHLRCPIALVGAYSRIERLDVPGATRDGLFQGGLAGGLELAVGLVDHIWLTPGAQLRWLPLGHVDIAEVGRLPFNGTGLELGVGVHFAPGW